MSLRNIKNRSGQVLLEAIVALTILSMATFGIFTILANSIGFSRAATDQDIAVGLASEGIEVIKHILNKHYVLVVAFGGGSPPLTSCSAGCKVQYNDVTINTASPADKLLRDTTTGLYNYTAGTVTPYSRVITITSLSGGDELKVVSKVTWAGRGSIQSAVELEDRFFTW